MSVLSIGLDLKTRSTLLAMIDSEIIFTSDVFITSKGIDDVHKKLAQAITETGFRFKTHNAYVTISKREKEAWVVALWAKRFKEEGFNVIFCDPNLLYDAMIKSYFNDEPRSHDKHSLMLANILISSREKYPVFHPYQADAFHLARYSRIMAEEKLNPQFYTLKF